MGFVFFYISLEMKEIDLKPHILLFFVLDANNDNSKTITKSSSIKLSILYEISYSLLSFNIIVIIACNAS